MNGHNVVMWEWYAVKTDMHGMKLNAMIEEVQIERATVFFNEENRIIDLGHGGEHAAKRIVGAFSVNMAVMIHVARIMIPLARRRRDIDV